ncbi:RNA-dependent RNA polymerase [Sclerotinia homoeocarpa fusarivirus 1]|uniref:RNA-dependent RNA polymerase n=1 Tax=Sclerotinia homoeocarpa fusarivirus 1 TaxID=2501221 RepID=A0AAD1EKV6_9VIRU|nr:RNA-dependent RNA polymerase [Sclerotinia homoeocarpa fusarivirus 1]AZT88661.1 RNA-dependent RNA polymerase [Sclerotinia homoeocarpa fusarivirus 1]
MLKILSSLRQFLRVKSDKFLLRAAHKMNENGIPVIKGLVEDYSTRFAYLGEPRSKMAGRIIRNRPQTLDVLGVKWVCAMYILLLIFIIFNMLSIFFFLGIFCFIVLMNILFSNSILIVILMPLLIYFIILIIGNLGKRCHIIIWDLINLIRGERSWIEPEPNFVSESIKLWFIDHTGNFDISEYQLFDKKITDFQMWYLNKYNHGLFGKIFTAGFIFCIYTYMKYLLKKGYQIAKWWLTWTSITILALITGLGSPLDYFCVAYWLTKGLLVPYLILSRLVLGCWKLSNYLIIKQIAIYASGDYSYLHPSPAVIRLGWDEEIDVFYFMKLWFKFTRTRFMTSLLSFGYKSGMIIDRKTSEEHRFKFRSLFTSFSLEVTRKINEINVPGWVRTIPSKNPVYLESTLQILREIGYPVGEVKIQEPQLGIAMGKFDDWISEGSNFITGLFQLRTYEFVEFNAFKTDVQEYRRSDSYVTLDNELESVARYFNNKTVSIPNQEKVVDEVWEMTKTIFQDSRITPLRSIYKKWKKNYNVGPFAPSQNKRRKDGGLRKMRRTEDIARFPNLTTYLQYWEKLYAHFPLMQMVSTAFYKSEALPEKKWRNNKVRTPIGSMLPQYLWQMVWSYEPNHRFDPENTPIKIGLPLTGFHLSQLFEKHSKFAYHYGGDCTEFDSTITKNIQEIIKSIRKKGFSRHRQYEIISTMIDINYERLNESKIVTPSTGNVYNKGTGLTTGHASTSSDNSLTLISLYMAAWVNLTGLSAHEFRSFNELSCYGDDHILSFSENAPKVWTFENIQKIFKTWGITMKNEFPNADKRDLEKISFLSKFARKSNHTDDKLFKEVIGSSAPKYVIYHDTDKLLGKMRAPVLNRDPKYKIQRVISYLDLCAHNEKAYYIGREVIEIMITKYPDLAFLRGKVPSYEDVLRKFYSPNTHVREPEERDVEDFDEKDIVEYGQMTILDYLFNYLSVIPDVLNPSIKNVGFGRVAQRALGPLTSWPKELLSLANNVYSPGHLSHLLKSTCYDFIEDRDMVLNTTPKITLILRHWLFLKFKLDSEKYNPLAWIDWMLQKLASLQFIINGRVQTKYKNYSFPVWNLFLLSLLNILVVPDIVITNDDESLSLDMGEFLLKFKLPDATYWISRLYKLCENLIWDQIPPNFKNLQYLEQVEHHGKIHKIVAGTGTGKSTTMILYLQQSLGMYFNKIIVIEPRSKVVKGLVSYVKTIGVQASGLTTGLELDDREKVWYMTAQELLLHPQWVSPSNLFVIDECHIDELPYKVVKEMLTKTKGLTVLLATATPTDEFSSICQTVTEIELPKIYRSYPKEYANNVEIPIKGSSWVHRYLGIVTEIMSNYRTPEKFLIFINDKRDLDIFRQNLRGRGFFLSSETEDVDLSEEVDFIVTTAVCDVAITIPGVTVVITPNFTRKVSYDRNGLSKPCFALLDSATLKQRSGRTGRTNNGDVYVIPFSGPDIIQEPTITKEGQIVDWLSSGLDLDVLAKWKPDLFDIFRKDLKDNQVLKIAEFLENQRQDKFKKSHRVTQPDKQELRELNLFGIHLEGITGLGSGFQFNYSDLAQEYSTLLKKALTFVNMPNWDKQPIEKFVHPFEDTSPAKIISVTLETEDGEKQELGSFGAHAPKPLYSISTPKVSATTLEAEGRIKVLKEEHAKVEENLMMAFGPDETPLRERREEIREELLAIYEQEGKDLESNFKPKRLAGSSGPSFSFG